MQSRHLGIRATLVACALVVAPLVLLGLVMPSRKPSAPDASAHEVQVLGSRLSYHAQGRGTPDLILLHGFGGTGMDHWGEVLPRLDCGRAIAPDLLGFGASSRPDESYSLEMHSRYLVAAMDALGIEQAVLVGLSMGGSLAALTAARAPSRVRGIVLLAPSGLPGSLTYPWPRGAVYRPGFLNRTAQALVRTPLHRWLFPHSLARQALGVTASYDETFAEALGAIHQPALLGWSRTDDKVPFAYHEEYQRRIPQLAFREAPVNAGHAISITAPAWTAETICGFVAGLSASDAPR